MNDPVLVGDAERAQGLHQDADDSLTRERPFFTHDAEEIEAVEVLHRDVEEPVGFLAEVQDADRVGVVELRRRLRLPVEALRERLVLGDVRVHHLDRHDLVEGAPACPVHRAHRALADQGLDEELVGDRSPFEG